MAEYKTLLDAYQGTAEQVVKLTDQVVELRAENAELRKAVGSALWVFNNLHNVRADPAQFVRFAEAAKSDCERALNG